MLPRLLLQIVIVIIAARVLAALARRLGQPSVIGEMAAGIALGPSLFGSVAPGTFAWVFPQESLPLLNVLSQVGVIIFLFSVGLDFNWQHVRHRAHSAVVISNVSIIVPFALGAGIALLLYRDHAPAGTPLHGFALFMGIAISITAFPVLARILAERNMLTTPVGSLALMCAAVNDVTAWTLLAFVVAVITSAGSIATVFATIGLTVVFVLAMVFVVRPLLRGILSARAGEDIFAGERIGIAIGLLFAAALATELIGIHALFGAFVAGATLPASEAFRTGLRERLESFTSVLLLPLFFAYTGLRTQIGLIDGGGSLAICLGIIVVATVGKLGGSALAARATGIDWNTSFVLGALMNTRGLMELIALNVGYDLGVISPEMFTILVLMALVTTAMTGPLVDLATKRNL
jgi:Kef-type K+ transport system membrane component KefB